MRGFIYSFMNPLHQVVRRDLSCRTADLSVRVRKALPDSLGFRRVFV